MSKKIILHYLKRICYQPTAAFDCSAVSDVMISRVVLFCILRLNRFLCDRDLDNLINDRNPQSRGRELISRISKNIDAMQVGC